MLDTTLNFAAALAGLIAAWRWYQTTTIRPPTELPYGGPTTIDTGPLVAFIGEIARLNRRAASWTAFAALWRASRPSHITTDDEHRRLRANPRLASRTSPRGCSAGVHTNWFLMGEWGRGASKEGGG
jgi:hypothetical protein